MGVFSQIKIFVAVGAVALTALAMAPQAQATVATLNFQGAKSSVDYLSGRIVYDYTGSTLNAITAFDLQSEGNLNTRLSFGVPNLPDTSHLIQILNNNDGGFGVYILKIASINQPDIMFYPEWTGLGTEARLVLNNVNAAGYSSYDGNALTSVGETYGDAGNTVYQTAEPISEPASMALLGLGVAALAAFRRRVET